MQLEGHRFSSDKTRHCRSRRLSDWILRIRLTNAASANASPATALAQFEEFLSRRRIAKAVTRHRRRAV
jgi:hypothetical protein